MKNSIINLFFSVIIILLFASSMQAQIKVGILPRLSASEMTEMFKPLVSHLSAELGQEVEMVIPKDFDTYMKMLKSGEFDYAYANPNVYVEAKNSLGEGVEPLVLAVETGSGKTFSGCFLVKKGSPLKSVSDFKGKKMIFVDEKSAGGYLTQVTELVKAGILKKDIKLLPFAKKHTNVALAVQNGVADVGGIRTQDFDKIKNTVNIPDVIILTETVAIPNWPLFKLPKARQEINNKMKEALLKLQPGAAKSISVLKSAKLDGFVETSDSDFDSMREVAKAKAEF
ncbi:MAG: phosphate/phosphite/phosphonate ABC transporter substrate-binding protein [Melioribacteraceae bacterium]|nr:phosphate/phosphite/phosphonate ABC transporter substrate-binding protein [Melioribacteraceae bacterium]